MGSILRALRYVPNPAVITLILVNTAIFFGVELLSDQRVVSIYDYCTVPARIWDAYYAWREGRGTADLPGAVLSLVTAQFLHGGPEHLIHNLFFLWIFGSLIEGLLGSVFFLGFFILGGMGGNLFQSYLYPGSLAPVLGASGAIAALEGTYLALVLRWELPWPHVFPMSRPIPAWNLAIMGVVGFYLDTISLMTPDRSIAYGAHIGGFVTGAFLGLVLTTVFRSRDGFTTLREKLTLPVLRRPRIH